MRRKEEEDQNKETFVTFSPINAGVSTGVLLPLLCVSPDVRLFLMFGLPSILGLLLTLVVTTFSNQCNCCRTCCCKGCSWCWEPLHLELSLLPPPAHLLSFPLVIK